MTKFKFYIIAFALLTLTFSCKKINPPVDETEANEPIYKLEGLMDGDSLKLYVNDSTVFINTSPYDYNGIDGYTSTMSDLENDFEISITVLRPEIFLDEEGVKLIEKKNVHYLLDQPVCLTSDFGSSSNQNNYFHINLGGQEFSGGNFGVKSYGIYEASLNFSNINTQTYTLPIKVGFKDEILNPYFELQDIGNNVIYFNPDNNDNSISHAWRIDDEFVTDTIGFSKTLSFGIHYVEHIVTDQYNNMASYKTLCFVNANALQWVFKAEENHCQNQNYNANNYGRAFIEILKDGEYFSTINNPTNSIYNIKIFNIEFITTENKQFAKFNVEFDAELLNKNETESLLLTNMQGVFQIEIN